MKKRNFINIILLCTLLFCSLHNVTVAYAEDGWPKSPDINAASAIIMEVESGAILYEKNSHDQHYPASITKIMTTLLALEKCTLSDTVHFSKDSVYNVEGTQVGITPDEELPLEECLYGIMLASGNEVAYAVAEHTGGNLDNFINMMNTRASELGCTNTHFNNPHGLPDENHYTSAYDMALISRQAYLNETFRNISSTKYHVIPPTNLYGEERAIANHHKLLTNSSVHYDYCTGGKTGYTNAARYNLVTFAEKDGMKLICVIMKDEESAFQYADTTNLFNYCFDNFHKVDINNSGLGTNLASSGLFPLENTVFTDNTTSISFDDNAYIIVPNSIDQSAITTSVNHSENNTTYIQYAYNEHSLGKLPVKYETLTSKPMATTASDEKQGKEFVKINVRIILYAAIGIITAALIILVILKLITNNHYSSTLKFTRQRRAWKERRK